MIDPNQLRTYIIRPVLKDIGKYSRNAEELLLLTAAQESALGKYIHQLNGGPAKGIYQMEPATHNDIWENFLLYRQGLCEKVWNLYRPKMQEYRLRLSNAMDKIEALPASDQQTEISAMVSDVGFDMQQDLRNPEADEMCGNLYYATAMARCHYLRVPKALPDADDIEGLAKYYKQYYNTREGKATPEEAIQNYNKYVGNRK